MRCFADHNLALTLTCTGIIHYTLLTPRTFIVFLHFSVHDLAADNGRLYAVVFYVFLGKRKDVFA